MAEAGDLQIWWVPQVPMTPFNFPVQNLEQGWRMLAMLAQYDLFQLEHNVKPDFSNAGGLNVFEDGEWVDWYDPETGDDIDAYAEKRGWGHVGL